MAFADASMTAAMLEVETSVDERAASLLGWRPLEIDHAPDPQLEVPATRAAASFALWRGDVADARRAVERGWALVRRAEDWALTARMAATYLEVQAAVASDARERHALPEISGARQRGRRVLGEAEAVLRASGVAAGRAEPARGRRESRHRSSLRCAARRPRRSGAVGRGGAGLGARRRAVPGRAGALASGGGGPARAGRADRPRGGARPAPRGGANRAGARRAAAPARAHEPREPRADHAPRRRAGRRARRAGNGCRDRRGTTRAARRWHPGRPRRPASRSPSRAQPVDAAAAAATGAAASGIAAAFAPDDGSKRPKEAFGLSRREREVLALIAEGRTNREIGERLFISQKTVGVHVGNILAKLGASGRVEAAMVAIRLELVPTPGRAATAARRDLTSPGPAEVPNRNKTRRRIRVSFGSQADRWNVRRRGRRGVSALVYQRRIAASTSAMAAIGATAWPKFHARRIGCVIVAISSKFVRSSADRGTPNVRTGRRGVDATKVMGPGRTIPGRRPPSRPLRTPLHRPPVGSGSGRTKVLIAAYLSLIPVRVMHRTSVPFAHAEGLAAVLCGRLRGADRGAGRLGDPDGSEARAPSSSSTGRCSTRVAAASRRTPARPDPGGRRTCLGGSVGAQGRGRDRPRARAGDPRTPMRPRDGDSSRRDRLAAPSPADAHAHRAPRPVRGRLARLRRAQVTGGNMEPGAGRMDFEFERMSGELVGEIEAERQPRARGRLARSG